MLIAESTSFQLKSTVSLLYRSIIIGRFQVLPRQVNEFKANVKSFDILFARGGLFIYSSWLKINSTITDRVESVVRLSHTRMLNGHSIWIKPILVRMYRGRTKNGELMRKYAPWCSERINSDYPLTLIARSNCARVVLLTNTAYDVSVSPATIVYSADHRRVLKTDYKRRNTIYDRIDLPQARGIENASPICSFISGVASRTEQIVPEALFKNSSVSHTHARITYWQFVVFLNPLR